MPPYVDRAPPALLNFIRCGTAAALVWMLLPFGPPQPLFTTLPRSRMTLAGSETSVVKRTGWRATAATKAARIECICNRPSDAAARSGDDRDAPVEVRRQTLTDSRG